MVGVGLGVGSGRGRGGFGSVRAGVHYPLGNRDRGGGGGWVAGSRRVWGRAGAGSWRVRGVSVPGSGRAFWGSFPLLEKSESFLIYPLAHTMGIWYHVGVPLKRAYELEGVRLVRTKPI